MMTHAEPHMLNTPAGANDEPAMGGDAPRRGDKTRSAIIDVALRLFRERGYEATTMRAIATEAGVSLGNAYYYFASKEDLIQGYYERVAIDHARAVTGRLTKVSDLEARIVLVITTWLDLIEPYHAFAGQFFRHAAEPTSPLSPFSDASTPARNASIALWRDVVEGSDAKIAKAIVGELPDLLWLFFMGHVLFWVYDQSPNNARTRRLAERTAPLVVRAVGLARIPVLRATIADLVDLIAELRAM